MGDIGEDLEVWYQHYPRHVAKKAAKRAYEKARKEASALELLEGIGRYLLTKPSYADYCFPATWLNQGRWMDDLPAALSSDWQAQCAHRPKCLSRGACDIRRRIETGRMVS